SRRRAPAGSRVPIRISAAAHLVISQSRPAAHPARDAAAPLLAIAPADVQAHAARLALLPCAVEQESSGGWFAGLLYRTIRDVYRTGETRLPAIARGIQDP